MHSCCLCVRVCWQAHHWTIGVCVCERELNCLCVCAVCSMSLFSQEPSLVRLSRLIYGPAGGACHNFLNLKSQPHPPISCSTPARAHCTTCSNVKTCAQPLCLYNARCMCVSRVPRMFVMSTRVSHCMCYLCICIFVCKTCV